MKECIKGIILFGDSVFFGIGASHRNKGCARILKKEFINAPVLIKARSFDSSKEGVEKLESVLAREGFSHVVLLFGNNDCRLVGVNTPRVPLKEFRANLKEMVKTIKAKRLNVLLANLQPIDSEGFYKSLPGQKEFIKMDESPYSWHKRYSDVCNDIANEEDIQLLDIRVALEKEKNNILAADGLHPNDYGHRIIASHIFKLLMR